MYIVHTSRRLRILCSLVMCFNVCIFVLFTYWVLVAGSQFLSLCLLLLVCCLPPSIGEIKIYHGFIRHALCGMQLHFIGITFARQEVMPCWHLFVTSATEGRFVFTAVCLFVCPLDN